MKEGWETKKLREVCVIDKNQNKHKNLPYVGLEHIEPHTGLFIGSKDPYEVKSTSFKFTSEHVLYGRLRPYLNKVMLPDFSGHCSTEIFPIRPKAGLSREFLQYWFLRDETVGLIDATSTGTRMPRANMNTVLDFEFPVPPLPEQKRIVAILDKAFDGIAKTKANAEKNLQNARDLFESHLNAVFSQRGDGWVEKPLESVAAILNGYAFKSTEFSAKEGVKCIKITNVGVKEFICNSDGYLPPSFAAAYDKVSVKKGSVVLALTRTIIAGGLKVAVVPDEYNGALLNQRVASIIANDKYLNGAFLFAYLSTQEVADYVKKQVNTLMQPNLSIVDLRSMPIPVPPRLEQDPIMEQIDGLREKTKRLESIYQRKIAALDELKKSLLHQAFNGQL